MEGKKAGVEEGMEQETRTTASLRLKHVLLVFH